MASCEVTPPAAPCDAPRLPTVSIYIIPNPNASSAEQATALRQAMAERSDITLRETERPEQAREFAAEAVQGSGRKNPLSWEKGKSRLVDGEELT